jgi:foldase protein PrsA
LSEARTESEQFATPAQRVPGYKELLLMKLIRTLAPLLVALALLLFAAACGGSSGDVPKGSVATVDGEDITKQELDDLLARVKKTYEANQRSYPQAGSPEYQALQTQAVAFLVQRTEYDHEADKLGLGVTQKEVAARVAKVKKDLFKGKDAAFKTQLEKQGYTLATFEDDVRAQLLSEKLSAHVATDVKVTDADVQRYYQQNKSQYTTPESRLVRHILVKTKAEATKVYDQLRSGADFAALAKAKSLDPGSKNRGGELTIARGQTVAPFEQTAFLLPVKSISRPVKTEFGWHIIQPLGQVKPAKTTPLAKVRAAIKTQLVDQRKQAALASWAQDVKKRYDDKVSYADGYSPPAAATTPSTTTG